MVGWGEGGGAGEKQEKKASASIETGTNILVCEELFPAVPTATPVNMDVATFVNTLLANPLKRLTYSLHGTESFLSS